MYYYKAKETSGKGWPEGAKATFKLTSKADLAKDDIKFVNTVEEKKKDITRTGDEAPLGVLFGGLGIGMAGLAVLLEDRKRRNRNK